MSRFRHLILLTSLALLASLAFSSTASATSYKYFESSLKGASYSKVTLSSGTIYLRSDTRFYRVCNGGTYRTTADSLVVLAPRGGTTYVNAWDTWKTWGWQAYWVKWHSCDRSLD